MKFESLSGAFGDGAENKIEKLTERLGTIARIVGGDFDMKVGIGEAGRGSYFNSENNEIRFDPTHFKEGEEWRMEFIAGHEGGHRAIDPAPEKIGGQEILKQWEELGWGYLDNCVKDCADNDFVASRYARFKELNGKNYEETFRNENTILGNPQVHALIAALGYAPKFVRFGSELMRYWFKGNYSANLDPEVKEALEKTKGAAKRAYGSIPENMGKTEVLKKGREKYFITRREIWPEMEKLIEKDEINESLRQMIKSSEFNPGKEGEGSPLDLPPELKKELEEKIKEAAVGEKKRLEEGREKLEKGEDMPAPMDEFSDELKKKLKEAFDNLPREEKKNIGEEAKKALEKIEDELNKEQEGKLGPEMPENHAERRARKEKEKNNQDKETREREEGREREKVSEEIKRKMEGRMSEYQKAYRELKPVIDRTYDYLHKFFLPQRHPRFVGGFDSGHRVNTGKAMQFEAKAEMKDASADIDFWERKTKPEKKDYKFSLLIDLSGSMRGEKIAETFKGLVVLAEVLNRLGIDLEITGFSTAERNGEHIFNARVFKEFREKFSEVKRNELSKITGMADGYTPTDEALEFASERLKKAKGKDSFLIVLTDGQPYKPGEDLIGRTKEDIARVVKADQKLIGVGLGEGTSAVADLFPAGIGDLKAADIPKYLAKLIVLLIKHPYLSSGETKKHIELIKSGRAAKGLYLNKEIRETLAAVNNLV